MAVLIVVSDGLVPHLALALASHLRSLSADGLRPQPDLLALTKDVVEAARRGQTRPALDLSAPAPDSAVVTPLAVSYGTAAAWLDCSPRTVRRRVAEGRLTTVGEGRSRRIRVADLEAFVAGEDG